MGKMMLFALATCGLLAACGRGGTDQAALAASADAGYQKVLQQQLLDAKPGDVIEIPAGRFSFDRSLSLRVDGVTIRGAGMDKTVLSFKGQRSGAEGLIVNASGFTLENLAIEDSKGDGLKVNEGEDIVIRGVRVEWTNGPHTDNGAYGLYPVQTKNVLIEDSVVIGASDAGIYVGQSQNVVVRRNRAERNVAGIEIENCIDADVYDNIATENTGGILVFNMPDLPQPGHTARVFKNRIFKNNTDNFGRKGTAVAAVPAGSGVVIMSNDQVEIFDNEIADNKTANVLIASHYSAGYDSKYKPSAKFDPYPEQIYIHDNRFSGGGDSPDGLDMKALKVAMFGLRGHFPDVFWDGYANAERAEGPQICVQGASGVLNADAPNKFKNPKADAKPFDCKLEPLPAVELKQA
ncbi:MAG: right-handed parallel beta-helix repeat-containing protein [Luteimonas sp.]|nr:right-handed parallel beta-helix repeat-containing protein [Luteimonas sp.]